MENLLVSYLHFAIFLKVSWEYFIAFLKLTHLDFFKSKREEYVWRSHQYLSLQWAQCYANRHSHSKFLTYHKI